MRSCTFIFLSFCQVVDSTLSARLLLAPTEIGGSEPALLSGLYVLIAGQFDPTQERHYVIYWPEDSTWDDSAASSVCRNRVTFMRWVAADHRIFLACFIPVSRYLTKMCDQVVALLSPEHSASIVWGDDDSDTESVDIETGDDDRLFTYEVAKRNEQEESAVSRPGFQVIVSSVKRKSNSNLSKDEFAPHLAFRSSCRLYIGSIDFCSWPIPRGNCSRVLGGHLCSTGHSNSYLQSAPFHNAIAKEVAVGTQYVCWRRCS